MRSSIFIHEAPVGLSLTQAISFWSEAQRAGRHTIGLVYTPGVCSFVVVDPDGQLRCCRRGSSLACELLPADAGEVYEARLFNSKAELRWLNDPAGDHRSVLIAERRYGDRAVEIPCVGRIHQTYIIWGKPHAPEKHPAGYPAGWTRSSTAQIGVLDVPIREVPANRRAALIAREYLGVIDEHGNVAVVEERLLGIARVRIHRDGAARTRAEGTGRW